MHSFISSLFLADIDSMFTSAAGMLAKISYLLGFISLIIGGWKARHDSGEVMPALLIALFFGAAGFILNHFFALGGLPTVNFQ